MVQFKGKKYMLLFIWQILSIEKNNKQLIYIVKSLKKKQSGIFVWQKHKDVLCMYCPNQHLPDEAH